MENRQGRLAGSDCCDDRVWASAERRGDQLPGCVVAGYRTGVADGSSSHTFDVFNDESAADAFASNVRANTENQHRTGVENVSQIAEDVTAHTTEPR